MGCPVQAECQARKTRVLALGDDERLSERIWRTVDAKGPSDGKTSLNDLMRAWKGAYLDHRSFKPLRVPHALMMSLTTLDAPSAPWHEHCNHRSTDCSLLLACLPHAVAMSITGREDLSSLQRSVAEHLPALQGRAA